MKLTFKVGLIYPRVESHPFSQQYLRQIIAQASPLAERLSAGWPADAARANDQGPQARLERWRQLVAEAGETEWTKYLV